MVELKIYADCSGEEATKTYKAVRLLSGTLMKVAKEAEKIDTKASITEQYSAILNIIKIVFPSITDEEIASIDSSDLLPFYKSLIGMANGSMVEAQKN